MSIFSFKDDEFFSLKKKKQKKKSILKKNTLIYNICVKVIEESTDLV